MRTAPLATKTVPAATAGNSPAGAAIGATGSASSTAALGRR